ncbi:MAG: DUF4375 domain-containing protein [Pseudomonadota bacterium]
MTDTRLSRTELGHDEDVLFAVADRLIAAMDEELEDEARVLAAATPGQRAVYLLFGAGAEIADGGMVAWLEGAGGRSVGAAGAAAEHVGAADHAAILREVDALFPGGAAPADDEARERALDLLGDEALARLDELEARWAAREAELRGLLEATVAAHPGEFFRD